MAYLRCLNRSLKFLEIPYDFMFLQMCFGKNPCYFIKLWVVSLFYAFILVARFHLSRDSIG